MVERRELMNDQKNPGAGLRIPSRPVADIELPPEVERLYDLAYNLWWSWTPSARELFSAIDGRAWAQYHNPVQLLINVDREHWEGLLSNETFLETYHRVVGELDRYLEDTPHSWYEYRFADQGRSPIAYLSMEYGLDRSLAIYSGGLGVLSGDHMKSASDLGVPLVGIGLLYRSGYFRQTVDAEGNQQHIYPEYDFSRLPIRPASTRAGRDIVVSVPIADREIRARVWVCQVGRIPILLLDTDIPENDPADRPVTNILYVRGRAMRLVQEIVLGVGGARALHACGIEPGLYHVNEGHSAFVQLERIDRAMGESGSFEEALHHVRSRTVFTTHTPVPAGNERFAEDLARHYLSSWPERLDIGWDRLAELTGTDLDTGGTVNLTALCLRSSRYANGVSRLHGQVSREMWQGVFDTERPDQVPIHHVTNGIHLPTWLGREIRSLWERRFGVDWQARIHRPEELDEALRELSDEEIWEAHLAQKRRLGRFLRSHLRNQFARHGRSPEELREVGDLFDPDALTLGFARRFATYKRAGLLFQDPHELRRLVADPQRPIQVLFAGKAHPADRPGQDLIRHIFQLSQSDPFRGRVIFLENYDMRIGGRMVQGVDVWLNTPLRRQEASGTSGQKAAANGAINCSILDGWWPEAFDGTNGWAIEADGESFQDRAQKDLAEAQAIYRLLAEEIVPLYYERDENGISPGWLERMRRSILTVTPRFSAERMVRDYVTRSYHPPANGEEIAETG